MPGRAGFAILVCLALWGQGRSARAQLFTHLQSLVRTLPTGLGEPSNDGPKGLVAADFNRDGQSDLAVSDTAGVITVFFGQGQADFSEPYQHDTSAQTLRQIIAADFNGDTYPDLAVAAPNDSTVYLLFYQGTDSFSSPVPMSAWFGARNLAAGDFDGDGTNDLVVAGPNLGLRQYRGLGNGQFAMAGDVAELNYVDPEEFPKPVYSLAVVRPSGSSRDDLVATHAETNRIWTLKPDELGALRVTDHITIDSPAHAIAVGPLFHRTSSTNLDLVVVQRDQGLVTLWESDTVASTFSEDLKWLLRLAEPRAVSIADFNQDGWNDLAIVLRNLNMVVTFANSNGTSFRLAGQRPAGTSPREIVTADLNQDDYPDAAVMNRTSADISLMLGYPDRVGFAAADQIYLVDGDVAGLTVVDFNGDKYDDVIQLHRASGDFSVWLMTTNGTLAPPDFYTIGDIPGSQAIAYVNGDSIPDLVAASLGTTGFQPGAVSVRLGLAQGGFGPEQKFVLPPEEDGRLFALVPADLDGNGPIDLAAGFLDSRIALFRNVGAGANGETPFTLANTHPFVPLARGLAAADFDGDNDIDLAGVGVNGDVWIVENQGNLLDTQELSVTILPSPDPSSIFRTIQIVDLDDDDALELLIGGGTKAFLFEVMPGSLSFQAAQELAGTDYSVSQIVSADFNLDGNDGDLVLACGEADCLSVFTRDANGQYSPALNLKVPASRFLATGDLDNDNQPDLMGSGKVLWIALSGRAPQDAPPLDRLGERARSEGVVINEFLAINTAWAEVSDEGRFVDWIELYNGGPSALLLTNWSLQSIALGEENLPETNTYTFPSFGSLVASGGRLMVYCSDSTNRSLYHTGWRLPGDGGRLVLRNPSGQVVDAVDYPPQQDNVAYARFEDGLETFIYSPFPSSLQANPPFGLVSPDFHFEGVNIDTFKPHTPIQFLVDVLNDVPVARLRMIFQRLDVPVNRDSILLHDDGAHGDGLVSDSHFAGALLPGFPDTAEIEFYFEITDLNDQVATIPEDPALSEPGKPGNGFKLAVGRPAIPLEVSELVAQNHTGLVDDLGGRPDWVEIRNTGNAAVSLDAIRLTKQLGQNSQYEFAPGTTLQPGEHLVVYCDDDPERNDRHAPFTLRRSGDQILLTGFTASRARTLIDSARFVDLPSDAAWARLGAGGSFFVLPPTPEAGNLTGVSHFITSQVGLEWFVFGFPTDSNHIYQTGYAPSLSEPSPNWITLDDSAGTGIERIFAVPTFDQGYFRVIQSP